jgi:hypothetical protein
MWKISGHLEKIYLEACSQIGKGGMHGINFAKKIEYQLLVLANT